MPRLSLTDDDILPKLEDTKIEETKNNHSRLSLIESETAVATATLLRKNSDSSTLDTSKRVQESEPEKKHEPSPEIVFSSKRRRSMQSIFSPQHVPGKESNECELFEFDQELLSDDINNDGFVIPRDAEERAPPLTFSFNNEFLFKEDKEDSARETLHLVEKLRMGLSKKSNSSQFELEHIGSVDKDVKKDNKQDKTKEKVS